MNSGRLKEYLLSVYLVGAAGFSVPLLRPFFITLTPLCLLLTCALLLGDACALRGHRFSPRTATFLAAVYLVALLVEMAGVQTGVIFGSYTYGRALGPRVAETPLLIGINWVLLVVASGALFQRLQNRVLAAACAALAMTGFDVVMEQVCHRMDMWSWADGRIPLRNYAAWFLLALFFHAAAEILHIRFRSSLARWIFGVQLAFFLWLYLFFEQLPAVRAVLAVMIILSLLIRGCVAWINFRQNPALTNRAAAPHPMVSVLIPARNEENNIASLLHTLTAQAYAPLEIVVCDDQSTDATAERVRDAICADPRIRLIQTGPLPHGWLGKNHACDLLSRTAQGRYLLFLDADVTVTPTFIESAVHRMQCSGAALLSLFPEQHMKTTGEWLTVPLMLRILLSLLPLHLVQRTPHPSLAAANGQCMLFDAERYRKYTPHRHVRAQRTEDIAIARHLKSRGEKIICLLGNGMIYCRMYTCYRDALHGFSRHVAEFFGGSFALAILFGLTQTTLLYAWVYAPCLPLLSACILGNAAIALLNARTARQPLLRAALFQLPQEGVFWHLLLRAALSRIGNRPTWKGRPV